MTNDAAAMSAPSAGSPPLRYASVCDGIGAAHAAWQPLGWKCEWTAEIDAFPSAVVEQRWGFENRGDITKFQEWQDDGSSIDVLVGGTPCQSFSVAGLRQGLRDPRGGLMLTFLGIAERYRPRWVVWENVPGVLSSGRGRDFGSFLGALGELGYGWAYRVLDAQWFGVAQRRRRVFVVGCLGDERGAAAVLFERESVRRDNPPSRAKGQGVTAATAGGTGGGGEPIWRGGDQANREHCYDHAGTLNCDKGQQGGIVAFTKPKRAQSNADDETWVPGDVAPTFNCFDQGDTRATTVVAFTQNTREEVRQINGDGQIAGALNAGGGMHQTNYVAYDITGTLATTGAKRTEIHTALRGRTLGQSEASTTTVVAFANRTRDGVKLPEVMKDGVTPALTNPGGGGKTDAVNVAFGMAVRRLTPRECERLQGFPDDYTAITYRNKPAADGPRYKALGNSMAVPVMRWIGERIAGQALE
jgi:DNA (cytosine-5)-methyltransferase 1